MAYEPYGGRPMSTPSPQPMDPAYNDYIYSVLADYGIQFSPGGSSIVGIDDAPPSPSRSEERHTVTAVDKTHTLKTEEIRVGSTPTHTSLSAKRALEESDHVSDDEDEILTIDESSEGERKQSVDLPSTSQPLPKKIKVYEMARYEDPDKERRRQNAIMARNNREFKKREIQELKKENQSLRHVIAQCNKVLRKTNSDVQQLQLELKKSKKINLRLEETVRSKHRELHDAHDKLVLYRGHIELIACSLEEDNPAKKLIEALLKRMPASRLFIDDVRASTSSLDPVSVKVKDSVE